MRRLVCAFGFRRFSRVDAQFIRHKEFLPLKIHMTATSRARKFHDFTIVESVHEYYDNVGSVLPQPLHPQFYSASTVKTRKYERRFFEIIQLNWEYDGFRLEDLFKTFLLRTKSVWLTGNHTGARIYEYLLPYLMLRGLLFNSIVKIRENNTQWKNENFKAFVLNSIWTFFSNL